MNRYFIFLKYDGTHYHGWQSQPNSSSIQEEIEKALSILLSEDVNIVGAGRTDTGVHARRMVAHFDIEREIDTSQLTYKLNRLLPKDISIDKVIPVVEDLHARFSAKERTYHYYVHLQKDPFKRAYSFESPYNLDFEKMNQAAKVLLSNEDFSSFCKSNSSAKTMICHVKEAQWVRDDENSWHFRITADRFLRNMVRAIVGTLFEVGRERMSIEEFNGVITSKNRSMAGESMPANALFLEDIKYDF
ncbi:MAG: tRNA pseudouridine(38-40) synthase TruA [Prevotella sp.]|nr:tRNA pseudouridine(38-40) synthase TruA [Prevotella sp.]